MKKVATIGSRSTPINILVLMEKIGAYLASSGYIVASGNCTGADQAFARGANTVDPTCVDLYLPWSTYERNAIVKGNQVKVVNEALDYNWFTEAEKFHPNWDNLKDSVRKLMARNIGIVENSCQVICWMDPKNTGGTGMGVRAATAYGIPVLNLYDNKD